MHLYCNWGKLNCAPDDDGDDDDDDDDDDYDDDTCLINVITCKTICVTIRQAIIIAIKLSDARIGLYRSEGSERTDPRSNNTTICVYNIIVIIIIIY